MKARVVNDALAVTSEISDTLVGDFLQNTLRLPGNYVSVCLNAGRVTVGGETAGRDTLLRHGQTVWLSGGVVEPYGVDLPSSFWEQADLEAVQCLFEDDHVLVVNKPAGMLVYPGAPTDWNTLLHHVAFHYIEEGEVRRVLHVHRLDKDTTGGVLYAKHAYSARALDALMLEREIGRTYVALVTGTPTEKRGDISAPIGRDRHVAGRYRVSQTGKTALTHYETLATKRDGASALSLIQCTLDTGRTHQIRVHLAHIGCPIVGDILYGGTQTSGLVHWDGGHALHAMRLRFPHPYEETEITVDAPLPDRFQTQLERLGFTEALKRVR